jgi:hypothetical protein
LTEGVGDPRAWQVRLKSLPSRTITSELLALSSIVGGTVRCIRHILLIHFGNDIFR